MRSAIRIICLGFLILTTGCESTRWNWLKRDNPPESPPSKTNIAPTTASLVQYLNDNSNRISSVRIDDISIDLTSENKTFGIRGKIFAEKPRNFRMKVTALGRDEVDIGSNSLEFWFWAAKNQQPHQYFCSYKDLNEGNVRLMPLPIQPEWVIEAMGMGPYRAENYQLEEDATTFRLVERAKSPLGTPVRKVIVMNRQPVKSPQPQVTDFLLLDDTNGQEICSAHISKTTVDRVTGAIMPYRMELRMPSQKLKMALKLDGMTVRAQIPNTAFMRQQLTGVEPFNLATGRVEPWGLQRTQGIGAPIER